MSKWIALLSLLCLGACASKDAEPGATDAGTAANTGDSATGVTTGAELQCAPDMFPGVDRACVSDKDCVLVLHQVDCCGTKQALGIDADDVDAFNQSEDPCMASFPGCGCPSEPTMAEDGKTVEDGALVVRCVAGACESQIETTLKWYMDCGDPACGGYVMPEGVAPCTAEQAPGLGCEVEGATCDPMNECNALVVCATKDPTAQGCPL